MFGITKLTRVAMAGIAVIVIATALCIWWVLRDTDVVLFEGLDQTQLNAVSTDLDRAGIPHRLDRTIGAINVAPDNVPQARIASMSSGNAFREAPGFELFNTSDFGMTEFAQRINYQRAVEGELARTIGSLGEIKYARVHLVLPEHGLFRVQKQQPRASVTVFPEQGVVLDGAQVRGIQRLITSAVPELEEKNVSVMDETGVILSAREADDDAAPSGGRLAQKQAVERYLADKVRAVLSQAIGAQRFAVSVDVTLELNQRTTTTERVLETSSGSGIKRIKESSRTGSGDQSGEDRQKEVEYDLGREVDQVVQGAGGIRRVQVGVIIDRDVGSVDLEALRAVIASAVGADADRGDKVAVIQHGVAVQRALETLEQPAAAAANTIRPEQPVSNIKSLPLWIWLLSAFAIVAMAGFVSLRRNVQRTRLLRQQELRRRLIVWADGERVEATQV